MAPTASQSIPDMELGNPYTFLTRGMKAVRPTNSVDGKDVTRSKCLLVIGRIEANALA
jgi:hypothetical protein